MTTALMKRAPWIRQLGFGFARQEPGIRDSVRLDGGAPDGSIRTEGKSGSTESPVFHVSRPIR